jgi:translation initiation factor IF-2
MARNTGAKSNHAEVASAQVTVAAGTLLSRPPIVVVMGHVDHGKTTLLDFIRKASVAAREAGGITQAVGAYEILHASADGEKRKITFIDTPGHEAFTAMRSRGAQAADLAILVVAADEGVKPQTREAIKILGETKTPFVVAFNKIDKASPGDIEKTKGALAEAGVLVEGYGGQVSWQGVSAKTGEGVDALLDLILLAADLEGLTYDAGLRGMGFVLEARRDPRRGIEVSVMVKNGTLRRGDPIETLSAKGRVKILENFLGKPVESLEPSAPAIVIGFEELPKVGELFGATADDVRTVPATAGAIMATVTPSARKPAGVPAQNEKKSKALNIILKASDAGSLEALSMVLRGVDHTADRGLAIVEESVGDITDGDVKHALATGAVIIGFKNRIEKGAVMLADAQSVRIITSKIVYDLEKAVSEFLAGTNEPVAGSLEVLAIFNQEKLDKQLVGGRVTTGVFRAKTACDIVRNGVSLGTGRILGLREKKNEITSAESGKEIGVFMSAPAAIEAGDKLVIRK